VSSVSWVSGGAEQYAYGPDNQRIWKLKADGTEEMARPNERVVCGAHELVEHNAGPVGIDRPLLSVRGSAPTKVEKQFRLKSK
jgi:hypothetical protein